MKDKSHAALFALFLGFLGVHKFYLGRSGAGVIYLLLTMTVVLSWIPALLGFVDFIALALMDKDEFNRRYNGSNMLPPPVVVNMLPPAGYMPGYAPPPPPMNPYAPPPPHYPGQPPMAPPHGPPHGSAPAPSRDVDQLKAELEKLNELRISGLLTEEEFAQQKARLLGG